MDDLLTISEISRRSGVASSALRFYEDKGLVTSERSGRGHRRYPRAVLRRVAFIVFAQKVGLSLEEIRLRPSQSKRYLRRTLLSSQASRSSPSCRATAFQSALIGPSFLGIGAAALMSALPNLNALSWDSPNA